MNGILAWGKHGLSPFLVLVLLFAAIHPAAAVTVTATNGLSCAGTRSATNLGCTAGEFTTIVNITNAPGAPTSCVAGEYVIYNGTVSLSGTNADRYDIGFFTGENGNDPGLNNASNFCSVATFPTTPLPWIAKDTDACGDFSAAGVDNAAINSIKVLCAGNATGAMMIPYTLVYSQNAGSVCTGPTNVVGGSTSKCNKGIATVPVATFTVNGSVKVTKKTVPAGDAQSFAFTASGTGPVMAVDTSFNLADNGINKQVRMGISSTAKTLTITETAADTNLWEPTATIACTLLDGITPAGFVATNGATRTITATLSNTNPNALCTLTNTRRTTTLATGTDPVAGIIIAPGAAATDVDLFTLQTSGGTETITSVTVNLSTNSGIGLLAITNNAGTVLGSTASPVIGSNTITVAGMSATTTLTTFKVRVTPLSHAAMPVPPGATYAITAPVTAWAGPNIHAGSDTNPNALTIDNLSPAGATATSGTAGNAQVTLNWTTSASTDFSRSVVLRWTGGTAGAEVPAEGTDYVNGNAISTATVVCVRTADAVSTAVSGVDGAGTGGCSASALTNGQAYTYKVFQKDANGNYDTGVTIGSFTPAAVSTFDACEVTSPQCTAGGARLFTKLVGRGFNLDLIALDSVGNIATSFTGASGTVSSIDLIAYTAANPANMAGAVNRCPVNAASATFNLGINVAYSSGRKSALAVAAFTSAYRDVRVRVTYNGTNYCSTDKFSVRPQALSIGVTNSVGGAFPATLAAGADFGLTASGGAGYDGTPASLDSSVVAQTIRTHVGATDYTGQLRQILLGVSVNTIAFPAAVSGASNAMVQYHDVGSFEVLAQKVIDNTFTGADVAGTDCVTGSASNADNDGNAANGLLYGCNITNTAVSGLFGRFYPSYYTLASSTLAGACGSSPNDFTYMGQSGLSAGYTLSAWSQANPTSLKLTKYTAGYSNLATVSVVAADGTNVTDLSSNLSPALTTTWSAGDYTVAVAARAYARPTAAPSGPYDSLNIAVGITGITDADGAALNGLDFKLGDPICTVSCTHKKLRSASTKVRFGRLWMGNAYGSDKLDLVIPFESQYWNGSAFVKNTNDSCTPLANGNIALGNKQDGLTAYTGPIAVSATSNGAGSITLTKPSTPAKGSVDLVANLGSSGIPSNCPSLPYGTSTSAALSYLSGKWCGSNYDRDPTARATFGIYGSSLKKGPIYIRESY